MAYENQDGCQTNHPMITERIFNILQTLWNHINRKPNVAQKNQDGYRLLSFLTQRILNLLIVIQHGAWLLNLMVAILKF
jgi:hypothetical protein